MIARVRTSTAATRARPTLWTPPFIALALASLAYFTALGMLIPALPRFVEGPLGGGDVAVGLVFGSFSVSAVLLRPVAGIFGDRRGRRPLLFGGAVIFAVSVLAYGMAATPATLGVIRLVGGAGEALFFVGMATTFTDLAPKERRGEAMSLASLALYLGIALGPLVGDATLALSGFSAVWTLSALLALSSAALVVRVPETRPDERPTGAAARPAARRRLVHPAGLLPGFVLFTSLVGMAGFLTFVPLHVLDIGLAASSLVLFAFAAVVVLIRSVGARLPDLLGPGRAIRAALAASVAGLVIVGVWNSPVGLVLGAVVLAVGVALLTPSVFALAVSEVPASERGQVMATTSAFIDVAFGVGPLVMGFVAAALGRPAVFLAGAVIAGGGLVMAAATRLGRKRPPAGSAPLRPAGATATGP